MPKFCKVQPRENIEKTRIFRCEFIARLRHQPTSDLMPKFCKVQPRENIEKTRIFRCEFIARLRHQPTSVLDSLHALQPKPTPRNAIGELWAVFFDGDTQQQVAVKQEIPFEQCVFSTSEFSVRVGDARLQPGRLNGSATLGQHCISWNLTFSGEAVPLFLLPLNLYNAPFPKAKSLVGLPMAVFDGSLSIDGKEIEVANWVGSQNQVVSL